MTPEQVQDLIRAAHESSNGISWLMAVVALGSILVSVTGVVVSMRSGMNTLASQLRDQGTRLERLTESLNVMSTRIAVLEYANGVSAEIPHAT